MVPCKLHTGTPLEMCSSCSNLAIKVQTHLKIDTGINHIINGIVKPHLLPSFTILIMEEMPTSQILKAITCNLTTWYVYVHLGTTQKYERNQFVSTQLSCRNKISIDRTEIIEGSCTNTKTDRSVDIVKVGAVQLRNKQ